MFILFVEFVVVVLEFVELSSYNLRVESVLLFVVEEFVVVAVLSMLSMLSTPSVLLLLVLLSVVVLTGTAVVRFVKAVVELTSST